MSELSGVGRAGGQLAERGVRGGPRGRLPVGARTLRSARWRGGCYVDKTAYAHKMAVESSCYVLSRPPRFGKSLLADTLKELFSGTEELFDGLTAHNRWDWTERRRVVRIDFSSRHLAKPGRLRAELQAQLEDIELESGLMNAGGSLPTRLRRLVEELHRRSRRRVAVLVDGYDKPILDALGHPEAARANMRFLREAYTAIHEAREHVRFALLTGMCRFPKAELFPAWDSLEDITLDPEYSAVCGFTEADLDETFAAELEGLDREKVREWYGGYSWLGAEEVHNPHDILKLLRTRQFGTSRHETASPDCLTGILLQRPAQLEQTAPETSLLASPDADRFTTEALLFQTGFITITDTQQHNGKTLHRLAYPNLETQRQLIKTLALAACPRERLADSEQRLESDPTVGDLVASALTEIASHGALAADAGYHKALYSNTRDSLYQSNDAAAELLGDAAEAVAGTGDAIGDAVWGLLEALFSP